MGMPRHDLARHPDRPVDRRAHRVSHSWNIRRGIQCGSEGWAMIRHQTFSQMIDELINARNMPYRSDPERDEAMLKSAFDVLQSLIEKLRDERS